MPDIFLVRQPVFGTTGALMGYEIRVRDSADGREAFARSILSGTFDLVRGKHAAFVTFTKEQLLDADFPLMEPASAILLLPTSVTDEPEVVEAIKKYHAAGGRVALDDMDVDIAPSESLLPYASWVRMDMRLGDLATIGRICDRVSKDNRAIKFMAHFIEEADQYDVALNMGIDAFQGTYFSTPEPVTAAELPQATVSAMRLMGMSRDPNVTDRQLEDVIATDPVLTFQLLRLVNSAAVGMRGVSSIGQALRLIGRTAFQRWLAVAVAVSRKSSTGVDQELVRGAIERGRLLEQVAGGGRDAGTLFVVGLFSKLDSVFRMPLTEILERVTLSDDATDALLHRKGPYAHALSFAEDYESGNFDSAVALAQGMGIDPSKVNDIYTSALTWTNEALGAMASEGTPGR